MHHLFVSGASYADVPTEQEKEVKHLLSFVLDSGCIINRNGSEYPSAKGVQYIKQIEIVESTVDENFERHKRELKIYE